MDSKVKEFQVRYDGTTYSWKAQNYINGSSYWASVEAELGEDHLPKTLIYLNRVFLFLEQVLN